VDYDGDGKLDLLGGQFGGYAFLAKGTEKGEFSAPAKLKDAKGAEVSFGKVWTTQWTQGGGLDEIGLYHLAVDWDGDGDLDLLTGGYYGSLGIRLNEGTRKDPKLSTTLSPVKAGEAKLKVAAGNSPAFADFDGDGLRDLVVASSKGKIRFYKNTGTAKAPAFAKGVVILTKPKARYLKVAAGDLNGDGVTDLVFGAQIKGSKHPIWVMYGVKKVAR
jgi:VCBS repeat protein